MSLAMVRVLQDPAHFTAANNCYFHDSSVCCMTDGRYRFLRWEGRRVVSTDPDLDESHPRIFESNDQGATWALLSDFDVPVHTQWNGLWSPGGDRLLAATLDKADYAYDATYSLIPRSEDGGTTWTSAVSQAFFDSQTFTARTRHFVKLPGTTTILAFGLYDVAGVPFNVLHSTDDGLTFTAFSAFSDGGFTIANEAVALSATDVIAVDVNGSIPQYSTDGGATWTEATKPAGFTTRLFTFAALGDGVVLAFGRTTAGNLGTIFRSTDNGQSYTTHALIGSEVNGSFTLRALSPTTLIAGAGGPSPTILQKWWLSEDAGATWTAASLTGDQVADSDSYDMTVTSDGHLLASLDRPTRATVFSNNFGEVWRGTVDGLVVSGGTCEAIDDIFPPGAMGPGALATDCIPVFSVPPCPPVCPDDPAQPAGLLVTPQAAGGGFGTALFLLGLAVGVSSQAIAALGIPTGCGATFANNHCAVTGC